MASVAGTKKITVGVENSELCPECGERFRVLNICPKCGYRCWVATDPTLLKYPRIPHIENYKRKILRR